MSKSVLKDIEELVDAGVITEEVADRIRFHYKQDETKGGNRLLIAFGIIGALLIGLGLILIIAHNWDSLPKAIKLSLAFLPLLISQGVCISLVLRKNESVAWREGCATFLILSVAACITLVSQIYNIHGNLGNFLLAWMILSLPVIYVLRSSLASLLYLVGTTWYGCEVGYFQHFIYENPHSFPFGYWALLAAGLPYYVRLLQTKPQSNFTYFHHWMLTASLTVILGTLSKENWDWLMPAYISLFGAFVLFGQTNFFSKLTLPANGFLVVGSLGTVVLLMALTFDSLWNNLGLASNHHNFDSQEFYATLIITAMAVYLLYHLLRNRRLSDLNAKSIIFILFIFIFLFGMSNPGPAQVLTNLLVFGLAVFTIREGAAANHLGRMNYGLLIIATLITCRFFDVDLSFVVRGVLFILVGTGFFAANYWMVQKRRQKQ